MSQSRTHRSPSHRSKPILLADLPDSVPPDPGAGQRRWLRWLAAAVSVVILYEVVTILGMRA